MTLFLSRGRARVVGEIWIGDPIWLFCGPKSEGGWRQLGHLGARKLPKTKFELVMELEALPFRVLT